METQRVLELLCCFFHQNKHEVLRIPKRAAAATSAPAGVPPDMQNRKKAKTHAPFRSRSRESNTNQNLKLRAEKHCGTVTTAFRYAGAYASTAQKTHQHTIYTVSHSRHYQAKDTQDR